jgi:YD repeat-containing protein
VAGQQTLVWDAEGHLTSASDTTGTSSFIYDADGNRLIRHDPAEPRSTCPTPSCG